MENEKRYVLIKDKCRKGLLKYLKKGLSSISLTEHSKILDVGCGSGIPALMIAEIYGGNITAIDNDTRSINAFREKIKELNLSNKIQLFNSSLFEIKNDHYNLILAEGLLNVVGFKKGFLKLTKLVKRKGYIIIHDESVNKDKKIKFIKNNDYEILDSYVLDEHVWWTDYFKCLEAEIAVINNEELLSLFEPDLKEIKSFKENPSQYTSTYYILKKRRN